jgi:peptide/nickel transport system substrate-binding protein
MSSAENPVVKLNGHYNEFLEGRIDRRTLLRRAGGLGLSAAAVATALRGMPAFAQDGSPVAAQPLQVISRADLDKQIREHFQIEDAQNTDGTIVWGDASDINTVNIILASDSPSLDINACIYETLASANPVTGYAAPALADSWERAEDGVTYTFHLNQQATWHDGTPFTAADVKFSLDAILNPDTASSYASSIVQVLKGYDPDDATMASVHDAYRVVDDHTFEVISNGPISVFIERFAYYLPVMAKHVWENVPSKEWQSDPGSTGQDPSRVVGTGPFKFVNWTQGESATFERFDGYYGNPAKIKTLKFVPFASDDAEINSLKAGDIDITHSIPATAVADLQSTDGFDVAIYDTWVFGWIGFQLDPAKSTLFQDVRVRQALMYATDRESIVKNIALGFGTVADGPQPTLSPAYAPDKIRTKYTYDPEKAKQLLDEAGWVAGSDGIREKDGQKLEFKADFVGSVTSNVQQAAYLQDAWKQVGVALTPNPIEYGVLIDELTTTFDFQMVFLGFNWDITGDQSAMFQCKPRGGFNAMNYCNPKFDELSSLALHELDYQKYLDYLVENANIINDDLPVIVVSFRKDRDGYNKRVRNFFPNSYGGYLWWLSYGYGWVEN